MTKCCNNHSPIPFPSLVPSLVLSSSPYTDPSNFRYLVPPEEHYGNPSSVKEFLAMYRTNMFWGERYNNQERPNISHGKVLAACVAILGAQPNTIRLINDILRMYVNRDYIRAKNRAAYSFNSH